MSTWLYLECQDHDPPLRADDESGQHLTDIPRVRQELADRDVLVRLWDNNYGAAGWSFVNNSIKFLAAHRKCSIRIMTEYGEDVTE